MPGLTKLVTFHAPEELAGWLDRLAEKRKLTQTIIDALTHWRDMGDDK